MKLSLDKATLRKAELTIKDEQWRFVFKRNLSYKGEAAWGLCDPGRRIIEINTAAKGDVLLRTVLHELFHALAAEWNFGLKHKKVYALEEAVFRLIKDNFDEK